jgi:D-glycero-D-manno-heptose 1,7-bisphosphate phosphatase
MNNKDNSQVQTLVILDRDGVINLDSDDYIKNTDEWIPIKSSLRAIAKLNQAGFKVAVATNQSGIGRGYFDTATLTAMHKKMSLELAKVGGHIDALEYCPDHPNSAGPNRKPQPGMALALLNQFNARPEKTWFVGDSLSDINCAINAHCLPALVLTGKGVKTKENPNLPKSIPIYENLAAFVDFLLSEKI